jgi:hypothetical protein
MVGRIVSVVLEEDVLKLIKTFKDENKKDKTPLDTLAMILYYFGDESEFTTDYKELHEAFYEFRNEKYFKEFTFKETGLYPYSELLEKIMSQLSIAGLLNCFNPVYRKFEISKESRERIEKSSFIKFNDEERKELREISKQIQSKLVK